MVFPQSQIQFEFLSKASSSGARRDDEMARKTPENRAVTGFLNTPSGGGKMPSVLALFTRVLKFSCEPCAP